MAKDGASQHRRHLPWPVRVVGAAAVLVVGTRAGRAGLRTIREHEHEPADPRALPGSAGSSPRVIPEAGIPEIEEPAEPATVTGHVDGLAGAAPGAAADIRPESEAATGAAPGRAPKTSPKTGPRTDPDRDAGSPIDPAGESESEESAEQPETGVRARHKRRTKRRRSIPIVLALLVLVAAVGTVVVWVGREPSNPATTAFYEPPSRLPEKPGELIRAEPFTTRVPPNGRGWRILYTTRDESGKPTVASGIVVVPTAAPADDTGHPVVAWAHGTTGYARQCAPSLSADPFNGGAFPQVLSTVLERGWAVVATDYVGLGTPGGHAYLVGKVAGQAVLDSVRAARELTTANLSDQTILWGHSQGGAAVLWANQLQSAYAPDVPLQGTVAMAPTADLVALARNLTRVGGGYRFSAYLVEGFAHAYPDVTADDVFTSAAAPLVPRIAEGCLREGSSAAGLFNTLLIRTGDLLRHHPATGSFGKLLAENDPTDPRSGPLMIAQGLADTMVLPKVQGAYVHRLREAGIHVDYRTYKGRGHAELIKVGSAFLPRLLTWTEQHFAAAADDQDNGQAKGQG